MLPFQPETMEAMRARLPAAYSPVITAKFCERFPSERPGLNRRHVFDYAEQGPWRLIISVDECEELHQGGAFLHVSMSIPHGRASIEMMQIAITQLFGFGVLRVYRTFATEKALHMVIDPEGWVNK